MNETGKQTGEPSGERDTLPKKVAFTVWLPPDVAERLREESHKRRRSVTEIVSESLRARYPALHPHKDARPTTGANHPAHIRRVVLEVLEELGLHQKTGHQAKRKPTSETPTRTRKPARISSESEARATPYTQKHERIPSEPEAPATPYTQKPQQVSSPLKPLFTDHGNGSVTDNRTGLTWLKDANCFGKMDWATATEKVRHLASGTCGLSDDSTAGDWRLPSREALIGLVDTTQQDPALPADHPFVNVLHGTYWSETSRENDTVHAWVMHLRRGRLNYNGKSGRYGVWPVRGVMTT